MDFLEATIMPSQTLTNQDPPICNRIILTLVNRWHLCNNLLLSLKILISRQAQPLKGVSLLQSRIRSKECSKKSCPNQSHILHWSTTKIIWKWFAPPLMNRICRCEMIFWSSRRKAASYTIEVSFSKCYNHVLFYNIKWGKSLMKKAVYNIPLRELLASLI